ncbi:MAG: DUF3108 domain-containing protein [Pseudomonadota bacterium]|nr:DUF3108 domain-containing protein [Pseudomonadota bacterium]
MNKLFILAALVVALALPSGVHAEGGTRHHYANKAKIEDRPLIPPLQPIVATYDVYVGGIHLLTADILFEEGTERYHALVKGKTYGIWYRLIPWDTQLDARGQISKDRFLPSEYATHDLWGKKSKGMKLHFRDGDITHEYDPPNADDDKETMTREQKAGALDPVTALLQMLAHVAVEKNCNVTVSVFDGKRRFDVTAVETGSEFIDEDDYGVFKGRARTCDARFKAVAGEWTDKVKARFWKKSESGEDREPFHVWLGQVSETMPELAVKLETGSAWGDIVMHLTKWRVADADDGVIVAPKTLAAPKP